MEAILAVIVVILVLVLFDWLKLFPKIAILASLADKPFVCPNCGHRFYVKWYQLIFRQFSVYTYNKANFKCPCCKMHDMCSRPHDC